MTNQEIKNKLEIFEKDFKGIINQIGDIKSDKKAIDVKLTHICSAIGDLKSKLKNTNIALGQTKQALIDLESKFKFYQGKAVGVGAAIGIIFTVLVTIIGLAIRFL